MTDKEDLKGLVRALFGVIVPFSKILGEKTTLSLSLQTLAQLCLTKAPNSLVGMTTILEAVECALLSHQEEDSDDSTT